MGEEENKSIVEEYYLQNDSHCGGSLMTQLNWFPTECLFNLSYLLQSIWFVRYVNPGLWNPKINPEMCIWSSVPIDTEYLRAANSNRQSEHKTNKSSLFCQNILYRYTMNRGGGLIFCSIPIQNILLPFFHDSFILFPFSSCLSSGFVSLIQILDSFSGCAGCV